MVGKSKPNKIIKLNYIKLNRGDGLGKNRHGMKECIQITKRYEVEGLGQKANKMNDVWWENTYNDILKKVNINEDNNDDNQKGVRVTRSRSRSMSMTREGKIYKIDDQRLLEKAIHKVKNDKNKKRDSRSNSSNNSSSSNTNSMLFSDDNKKRRKNEKEVSLYNNVSPNMMSTIQGSLVDRNNIKKKPKKTNY